MVVVPPSATPSFVLVAEPPTFDVDGWNQDGGRPGSEGLGNGR
jgi:hypothetical protein